MGLKIVIFYFVMTLCLLTVKVSAEEFIVGLNENGYPPFYFAKENSENLKGIHLEIFENISAITGDTFCMKYLPPKRLRVTFEIGELDIDPGVNPDWRTKWKDISVYSIPFAQSVDVAVFRKGEKFTIKDAADLKEKKVVTVGGYYYPGYEAAFNDSTIRRYNIDNELVLLRFLQSPDRDANAGFINLTVLKYYIKKYGMAFEVGDIIGEVPVMFRFHKSKQHVLKRFNDALKTLIENGTIDEIYQKYEQ